MYWNNPISVNLAAGKTHTAAVTENDSRHSDQSELSISQKYEGKVTEILVRYESDHLFVGSSSHFWLHFSEAVPANVLKRTPSPDIQPQSRTKHTFTQTHFHSKLFQWHFWTMTGLTWWQERLYLSRVLPVDSNIIPRFLVHEWCEIDRTTRLRWLQSFFIGRVVSLIGRNIMWQYIRVTYYLKKFVKWTMNSLVTNKHKTLNKIHLQTAISGGPSTWNP